jgi:hypothetical protein
MFDVPNAVGISQSSHYKDNGINANRTCGYRGIAFSDQRAPSRINRKRDVHRESSSVWRRQSYWSISSPSMAYNSPLPKNVFGFAWDNLLYHSADGDKASWAMPKINELRGGEEKMFEFAQTHAVNPVEDEADTILAELSEIESRFGNRVFIEAYSLAQHTFDESDKEWEEYLREERKRQAILNEA